jgi:hypothetical protein
MNHDQSKLERKKEQQRRHDQRKLERLEKKASEIHEQIELLKIKLSEPKITKNEALLETDKYIINWEKCDSESTTHEELIIGPTGTN